MKSYLAGILIGIALITAGYFFARSRIYIPTEKQERAATQFQDYALELEKKGEMNQAIKIYKKIVKRCPKSSRAEPSLYRIFDIYSATDKKKMIETADWYLKKYPAKRGSEISTRVGEYFLFEKQDLQRAEKLFIHSIMLASSIRWAVTAQERLSDIYYRRNDYLRVIELNNKLIAAFESKINADYYRLLNLKAYWRLGRQKEAYKEAKKIKDPEQPAVKNEILYWKVLNKFEPENAVALMYLGDAYLRMGFKKQAENYWKEALAKNPRDANIRKRIKGLR